MRRPLALTAAVAVASLLLAGCAGEEPVPRPSAAAGTSTAQSTPAATPAGTELPTVAAAYGEKPTIEFPGTGAPEELRVEVLHEGDGGEVGEHDFVMVNYVGQIWDGEIFDSSFERGAPAGFGLDDVITGWQQGLAGTHVGDRVLISIPPGDLGYAGGNEAAGIGPEDTLVFVVDVLNAVAPDATAQADAALVEPAPELPVSIDGELGEQPSVTVDEGATEPTEHSGVLLARGSGTEVPAEGAEVYLQYSATVWDNSRTESTWEDLGQPLVYSSPSGTYFDQLIGMPAGSRAVLLVAPEGDSPAMAAVVDIISVVPTG